MSDLAKCQVCGAQAVWELAPADSFGEFCDEHVPRGCSCNVIYRGPDEEPRYDEQGLPIQEQERDERGRLLPCCEYDFYPEGFPPGDPRQPDRFRQQRLRSGI